MNPDLGMTGLERAKKELEALFGESAADIGHFLTPWHLRTLLLWHTQANDALAEQTARLEALEQRLEQWEAEAADKAHPEIRPMTRIENRCMDLEGEVGYLQAALYHAIEEGSCPEGFDVVMDHEHGLAALQDAKEET